MERNKQSSVGENWDIQSVAELQHESRVDCISWSPLANSQNKTISLAAGGSDKKIRFYYNSFSTNDSQHITLEGHTNYINSIACAPLSQGFLIASVSDDHSCRIWDLETGQDVSSLLLKSPGVAVKWHNQVHDELMVAEKAGVIKIFDLRSGKVALSLNCPENLVQDADWNTINPEFIGAAVGGDKWYIWACSGLRPQFLKGPAHTPGIRRFRWSMVDESWFATSGGQAVVSIWNKGHPTVPVSYEGSFRATGLSWIYGEPYLLTGGDRKLHFWMFGG
jgi:nuclear pore complex protein Nup37